MTEYVPYTYRIYHKPTKVYYYGSKASNTKHNIANPATFWVKYFTSSPAVKELIKLHGKDSFDIKITKTFTNKVEAAEWKYKFLSRIDAASRSNWLNKSNGKKNFHSKGTNISEKHKLAISNYNKGKIISEHTRKLISQKNSGRVLSDDLKNKISKTMKEKGLSEAHLEKLKQPHSDDHKLKNRLARVGSKNHFYGKSHSIETKEKMSKLAVERTTGSKNPFFGRKHSKETKQKIREKLLKSTRKTTVL